MASIRAVVVDPAAQYGLALKEVESPKPAPAEVLIRVAAVSLNRGEVKMAAGRTGWRPGWDFAGTVEQPAKDGSGPATGARVVGLLPSGSWAEQLAAPVESLAVLPDAVSFAQAAALPVAGLTALHGLKHGGLILGKRVLITGASGGVGHFAVQLAHQAGAHVTGALRNEERAAFVRAAGADDLLIGEELSKGSAAPFDVILESVGGESLGAALGMLTQDGICVNFGVSSTADVSFNAGRFFGTGGARLYGLILFHELKREPAGIGLSVLARMIAAGTLNPEVTVEDRWEQLPAIAQQLIDRRFPGKAVVHLSD